MTPEEIRGRLQAIAEDDGAWVEETFAAATPEERAEVERLLSHLTARNRLDGIEGWLRRDLADIIRTFGL